LSAIAATILVVLGSLAGCRGGLLSGPSSISPVADSPIRHVVVVMQENRSFDNLFNGYPGADTVQTGMSLGAEVPMQPVSLADPRDLDHSHPGWWQIWMAARWMASRATI
jgi:phospholipase C